jgi:NitT/TauT family transport system substrate-binding protein/putative hydroxymethylpyrimidine transport system substrate-binding protein
LPFVRAGSSASTAFEKMNQTSHRRLRVLALIAAVALGLFVVACGEGEDNTTGAMGKGMPAEMTDATLVLDFLPNGVHAGIFRALEAGYYEQNNLNLTIIQPTSTADTLKLIAAGKAEFGIAEGIDVGKQIDEGRAVKGIMALLERPPGGLITLATSGIDDPKQLEGRTVGITGVPSDLAILKTVVSEAGGDPDDIDVVTIGFNGVLHLESGKVDAFTGFVPADGVRLEQNGERIRSFSLDEWGGPSYPGLVVFSTQDRIESEPAVMQAFVSATIRGYEGTFDDPKRSVEALANANPGTEEALAEATLEAYMPLFRGDAPRYGLFVEEDISALSEFMVENDLASGEIAPSRFGTNEFVEGRR